ncbi:MAG: hypothetical protein J6Y24_06615 [Bacteroidales bacterium]|nr:hypothetical protein [Bacteroidales bacterium]
MNNDKTEFRIIASNLEKLLLEYKKTYPKNFGQILLLDIPIYALLAAAVVIFSVIPFTFFKYAIFGIFILSIPLLYSRYKDSEIRKVVEERRHYSEIQSNLRVKIRQLKADRYSKYPDVKIYLKKYNNELKEVERHKQKILDLYHLFVAGILALFIGGIVLIYQQQGLKDFDKIVNLIPSNNKYVATIKPLATKNNPYMEQLGRDNIIIKYNEEHSVFTTDLKKVWIPANIYLRLMITDSLGHPVNGIPIFIFHKPDFNFLSIISIETYIVNGPEDYNYEINRRVNYLHKYGSNFRYIIEEYE